jgi:hypothetical protein
MLVLLSPVVFQRVEPFADVAPVVDDGLDGHRHCLGIVRYRGPEPDIRQLPRRELDTSRVP